MSTEPSQTCRRCKRRVPVVQTGRGFPPDNAKRKLRLLCAADGCPCEPEYRAGIGAGLEAALRRLPPSNDTGHHIA